MSDLQESVAACVARHLVPYLGRHTAKTAVTTFARKAVNKTPDELSSGDIDPLLEGLKPMLLTFAGASATESLLQRIRNEVAS